MTNNSENLSPVKRALLALQQMQAKLEAMEQAKNQPIAIVGMGCRFPGKAETCEDFWQLLVQGKDAITEVPPEHWNNHDYYDPQPNTPGKIYTRYGGFIPNLYDFDAQFFRLSPREATSLDPQQRLLLEVAWEALENSAIAPDSLLGSPTGVFIGISGNDYWHRLLKRQSTEIDAYVATGNSHSMASGRLSYILGLTGPSLSIDTACSSSLVAVHLAVKSLRDGECDVALAGGVNRILLPEISINFCQAKMLSPQGHCYTFDAAANGFVRAEGCGIIVLKRLSDAIASRDNILGVISGSAVNHDGRTSGLTVPNGVSQQAVIRKTLENANLEPNSIDYLETHGTGTSLGDPIEIGALDAVFSQQRPQEQPLIIGSVKTNIGHAEAAAGIASLIKVVLALNYQQIPPHLHWREPNPHINWEELPLLVPTETIPWQKADKPRAAGVSSFGFSGTNAHVIVSEYLGDSVKKMEFERPLHLFTLSAKTEIALKQLVESYRDYLVKYPDLNLGDICLTVNSGRSHFNHRLSLIAASTNELQEKLNNFLAHRQITNFWYGKISESKQAKIGFLLLDSDLENINFGEQLFQTQLTFQNAINRCAKIIDSYLERPLLKILYPKKKAKKQDIIQRQFAIFALQYALLELWQSWGIKPTTIISQGVGEYAAAIAGGIFTLEDGLKMLAIKSKLLKVDLQEFIEKINLSQPDLQIISYGNNEIINPEYWLSHPSEISTKTIQNSSQTNCQILINLGINQKEILVNKDIIFLASLSKEKNDWQQILSSLAELYQQGININWLGFEQAYQYQKIILPNYVFQRQYYGIS